MTAVNPTAITNIDYPATMLSKTPIDSRPKKE